VLGELQQEGGYIDAFIAKITELTKMIDDHVDEEETEMISKAKEMFDRETVWELSDKFDEVDPRISQKANQVFGETPSSTKAGTLTSSCEPGTQPYHILSGR
jgi:thioredoxin-like negative regulator of GroEL